MLEKSTRKHGLNMFNIDSDLGAHDGNDVHITLGLMEQPSHRAQWLIFIISCRRDRMCNGDSIGLDWRESMLTLPDSVTSFQTPHCMRGLC